MMGYLLKKPEILQNEETEWRMLDASIKAGAIDGIVAQPVMCVDGLGVKAHQGLITLLHTIVKNALSGT
jgi:hypothetical protein